MTRFVLLALAASVALAGCADPAMEQRMTDLEAKVAQIEANKAAPAPKGAPPAAAPQVDETAADAVATKIQEAQKTGDAAALSAACTELQAFRGSKAQRAMSRVCDEAMIVGIDAGEMKVEKWYQGETDMTQGKATLLVFWEAWCPHCRKEVPEIQNTYTKYKDQGLNVIGLTRVTKSATDEKVMELINENHITYPIAKETGEMAPHFGVRGIPAAAMVKDGKVVWRGHPARLTDEMIAGWLQ
ncbi:MAG: TlpA family protein disulfide reductase [Deltaproteobacteria bacterium]|nr:TlpA family protein disulfide reductase [Deltaproteobacteria bacterium]